MQGKQKKNIIKYTLLLIFIGLIAWSGNSIFHQTKEPLIKTVYASDFSSIIAAAGTDPVTLKLTPGTYDVASDLTVPYNVTLNFDEGAVITIADGATLYINGPTDDCLFRIFDDRNTDFGKGVKFRPGTITFVRSEWWGAKNDNNPESASNNAAAIEKAMWGYAELPTVDATYYSEYGVRLLFETGVYYVDRAVKLKSGSSFTGEGDADDEQNSATIRLKDNSNSSLLQNQPSTVLRAWANGMELVNMRFHGGSQSTASRGLNLIKPDSTSGDYKWVRIRKCYFTDFGDYAIYLDNIGESYLDDNVIANSARGMFLNFFDSRITNNKISIYGDYGVYMSPFANPFQNNVIEGDRNTTTCLYNSYYSYATMISGNTIRNCRYGIRSAGSSVISGNTIENNLLHGIYIGKDSSGDSDAFLYGNVMLSNNNIINNGGYGVKVDNTGKIGGGFITDNNIKGNTSGAIFFHPDVPFSSATSYHQYPLVENNAGVDVEAEYPTLTSSVTPAVTISGKWKTNNVSPVTITDFAKAPPGKEITIYFGDNNTTVNFSGATQLKGNGKIDWKPSSGDEMKCRKWDDNYWYCECYDKTP